MALATAAKHTLQILELLEERRMSYTFPIRKTELLLCSGFSLLWQCVDLAEDSKITKDNQKTLGALTEMLTRDSQTAGDEFLRIGSSVVKISACCPISSPLAKPALIEGAAARSPSSTPAPKQSATKKGLQAIAARFPGISNKSRLEDDARPAMVPYRRGLLASRHHQAYSTLSLSSTQSTPALPTYLPSIDKTLQAPRLDIPASVNLDYLPLGEDAGVTHISTNTAPPAEKQLKNTGVGHASWEQILTKIDDSFISIYDANVLKSVSDSVAVSSETRSNSNPVLDGEEYVRWAPPSVDGSCPHPASIDVSVSTQLKVPQSVLSFSDESLTSGEDLLFSAAGSHDGSTGTIESADLSNANMPSRFKGIAMPSVVFDDDFSFGSDFDGHH